MPRENRLERFNRLINSLELRVDECYPDIAAYFVDTTEVLNEALYIDDISKSDYNAGKHRIDNLANKFYQQCLCRNIKKDVSERATEFPGAIGGIKFKETYDRKKSKY